MPEPEYLFLSLSHEEKRDRQWLPDQPDCICIEENRTEDPLEAARREFGEELGFGPQKGNRIKSQGICLPETG